MADDVTVNVQGLSDLQTALENLRDVEAKKIVRQGLNKGGDALRNGMQVQASQSAKGQIGRVLGKQESWSKRIKMDEDRAGRVFVGPKGSLPDLHRARGGGMQPKGSIYRRSLNYLVKLMEFGGREARAANVGHTMPMTRGFAIYRAAVLQRVVDVIRERLKQ